MNIFAKDVLEGLSSSPKKLSSKYFYDKEGDRLFQQIMELPEYYLTRSEFAIFEEHKEDMRLLFGYRCKNFDLIEFGAGDASKTKLLIEHFLEKKSRFKYFPIDISPNVIELLNQDLKQSFHCLNFEGQTGDYFDRLSVLQESNRCKKVIFFLGSNIGNFEEAEAVDFCQKIGASMNEQDYVMIGFDLKKDPDKILSAYNDSKGVTRNFNLNLLTRMNRELGANFIVEQFMHYPVYNPLDGSCRSFLVSRVKQEVYIEALEKSFWFDEWEAIDMEVSNKYSVADISRIADKAGFEIVKNYFDKDKNFVDSVWKIKD